MQSDSDKTEAIQRLTERLSVLSVRSTTPSSIYAEYILKKFGAPGVETWDAMESLCIAALARGDMKCASECLTTLRTQFSGKSTRVWRLMGLQKEVIGDYDSARAYYKRILTERPTHNGALKRIVSVEKAQGRIDDALTALNEYVELYPADESAWQEIAELHLSCGHVDLAKYCYEELIVLAPHNYIYHLLYAECLYTLGGKNIITARQYFAQSLELKPHNARALYGMLRCIDSQQSSLTKGELQMRKEVVQRLRSEYEDADAMELLKTTVKPTGILEPRANK